MIVAMSGVARIGRMGLRVRDLDAAVSFQTVVLGLVETERRGRVSYLTCNKLFCGGDAGPA